MTSVLCCGGSIRDILTVAKEHFGNLVFYHDEYYQIYADEKSLKKLPDIQYDERKGTYVQDAGVINQFRTSDSTGQPWVPKEEICGKVIMTTAERSMPMSGWMAGTRDGSSLQKTVKVIQRHRYMRSDILQMQWGSL